MSPQRQITSEEAFIQFARADHLKRAITLLRLGKEHILAALSGVRVLCACINVSNFKHVMYVLAMSGSIRARPNQNGASQMRIIYQCKEIMEPQLTPIISR